MVAVNPCCCGKVCCNNECITVSIPGLADGDWPCARFAGDINMVVGSGSVANATGWGGYHGNVALDGYYFLASLGCFKLANTLRTYTLTLQFQVNYFPSVIFGDNIFAQAIYGTPQAFVLPASAGQIMPQDIINIASTIGFPSSGTAVIISRLNVHAVITYTGLTATSLTGCKIVSSNAWVLDVNQGVSPVLPTWDCTNPVSLPLISSTGTACENWPSAITIRQGQSDNQGYCQASDAPPYNCTKVYIPASNFPFAGKIGPDFVRIEYDPINPLPGQGLNCQQSAFIGGKQPSVLVATTGNPGSGGYGYQVKAFFLPAVFSPLEYNSASSTWTVWAVDHYGALLVPVYARYLGSGWDGQTDMTMTLDPTSIDANTKCSWPSTILVRPCIPENGGDSTVTVTVTGTSGCFTTIPSSLAFICSVGNFPNATMSLTTSFVACDIADIGIALNVVNARIEMRVSPINATSHDYIVNALVTANPDGSYTISAVIVASDWGTEGEATFTIVGTIRL